MNICDTPKRIVVVEDDPGISRVIELCLEQPTRQIDLRRDGDSGLAAIRDLAPDLVILDIALPDIDGWEILRQLRERDGSNVTILVLTAHADSVTRDRAEDEGADAYMAKPFRPADLRTVVDLLVCR